MAKKTSEIQQIKKKYQLAKPNQVLEAEYFYYEKETRQNKDLAIVCGGYEKCAPDYEIHQSDSPFFVIKYTIKGAGSFIKNSKKYGLKSGTLSSYGPEDKYRYKGDPKEPMEHIFVIFAGEEALSLLEKSTLAAKGVVQVTDPGKTLYFIKTIMNNGFKKSNYSQQINCSLLRAVLLEQASMQTNTPSSFSLSYETYKRCKKVMDKNFSHIKSINELADSCAINIRYLARLFKRYDKVTPHEYIMRQKTQKAADLLLSSSRTVSEISYSLGFTDPYHFSRVFKRFYGMSPHHYRKTHMFT